MKEIEVVAAIIRKGDCIFATQRGYGEFLLILFVGLLSVLPMTAQTDAVFKMLKENGHFYFTSSVNGVKAKLMFANDPQFQPLFANQLKAGAPGCLGIFLAILGFLAMLGLKG